TQGLRCTLGSALWGAARSRRSGAAPEHADERRRKHVDERTRSLASARVRRLVVRERAEPVDEGPERQPQVSCGAAPERVPRRERGDRLHDDAEALHDGRLEARELTLTAQSRAEHDGRERGLVPAEVEVRREDRPESRRESRRGLLPGAFEAPAEVEKASSDSESVGDADRYRTLAHLEERLNALPGAPQESGRVALIVVRGEHGRREQPERIRLEVDAGVPGDAWGRQREPHVEKAIAVMQIDVAE